LFKFAVMADEKKSPKETATIFNALLKASVKGNPKPKAKSKPKTKAKKKA